MATKLHCKPAPAKSKPPPTRRGIRLTSCRGVRRELASLYVAARLGKLPTADASRLASVLDILRRCIEGTELEVRLRKLEAERAAPASLTLNVGGRP